MTKSPTIIAILLAALAASTSPAQYQEGRDYERLPTPVRTSDPSKIEVMEVFAYSCIHCFRFENTLNAWAERQRDDVVLVLLPVAWGGVANLHARAFYTSRALKLHDEIHNTIFEEIHIRRRRLASKEQILKMVEAAGHDAEKYGQVMESFGVNSQLQQAQAKTGALGVRSTPSIIINGKYRVAPAAGRDILAIMDHLVQKEREAAAAAQ